MGRGQVVTDAQVKELRSWLARKASLKRAAMMSGMDRKTARKYAKEGPMPSQRKQVRTHRTRRDPLESVWPAVVEQLEREPGLTAKTLLEWLEREHPGEPWRSRRRTLERRVRQWKAQRGPAKEVFFEQRHEAGRLGSSDFTRMGSLEITIGGERFDHMLHHYVLTWSNWEHATICFSESFASLSEGLQRAWESLGGVPERHRTDRLTMAVNRDGSAEEFTSRYGALLRHYGIVGEATNAASAHENGDCEQSHRRLKESVEQALLFRGSRDFGSREEYEEFLREVLSGRNAGREPKASEERAKLRPLPAIRLETSERVRSRVRRGSTIAVLGNTYSVPSRLIGEWVEAWVGVEEIEVRYAGEVVQRMPRLRGQRNHRIDYRHVVEWLVRKPGAFSRYCYREEMFPGESYRRAYEALGRAKPERADTEYVRILRLASREGEEAVAGALEKLLSDRGVADEASVQALLGLAPDRLAYPELAEPQANLEQYDSLLDEPNWTGVDRESSESSVEEHLWKYDRSRPLEPAEASNGSANGEELVHECEHGSWRGREQDRGQDREPGRASVVGPDDVSDGVAFADDACGTRVGESASVGGGLDTRRIPAGVGEAGVRPASSESDRASAADVEVAAGEELVVAESEAIADEGVAATSGPFERRLLGSPPERVGVRSARLGEDARIVRALAGVGALGPPDPVHDDESVGAGVVGGQTRPDAEGDAQASLVVGRPDPG
jgi:hypothetical protein